MTQAEPLQQAPPTPVPEEQTTSPWAGRAARTRSFWNGGVTFAHDVGEWAKLVTLVLAIAGLLGFLFPGVKRYWEIYTGPKSWYYIGRVEKGTFHHFA